MEERARVLGVRGRGRPTPPYIGGGWPVGRRESSPNSASLAGGWREEDFLPK